MAGAEGEASITPADAAGAGVASAESVSAFLSRSCHALFDLGADGLRDLESALRDPAPGAGGECVQKYASDGAAQTLVVYHALGSESSPESSPSEAGAVAFAVRLEVAHVPSRAAVAFLKKDGARLVDSSPLAGQIQVFSLPPLGAQGGADATPYDALHSFMRAGFSPLFRSFAKTLQAGAGGAQHSQKIFADATSVNQKIVELELALYNCSNQVQIPRVVLRLHPEVEEAVSKALAAGKPLTSDSQHVDVMGTRGSEEDFLHSLQANVNTWIPDVQQVTMIAGTEEMSPTTDTQQEILFWSQLEKELVHIQDQLNAPAALVSLTLLKRAKRFITTSQFDTDTIGLRKGLKQCEGYRPVVKDFPLKELLAAEDINALADAIRTVVTHIRKSCRTGDYPVARFLRLMEALSRDVADNLLTLLADSSLMSSDYETFDRVFGDCSRVFRIWDTEFQLLREVLRDLAKKRGQGALPLRITTPLLSSLRQRVDEIKGFRQQHSELASVVGKVLARDAPQTADAIREAFDEVKQNSSDVVLQLSPGGKQRWDDLRSHYDSRVDLVEAQITAVLRDRLSAAKSAAVMFRVFQQFNALFVRPRVRSAIREYQAQLVGRVKQDISALHEQFKQKYAHSEAANMAELKDVPPVSGAIIWARQLQRQLDLYMQRVEAVIGQGWELDVDGQQLKQESDSFRTKLNTDHIFEAWARDMDARQKALASAQQAAGATNSQGTSVSGPIFSVSKRGTSARARFILDVAFDAQMTVLFKEVRNLQWLKYRVPFGIVMLANSAKQVYPMAVSLRDSLRTYTHTCARLNTAQAGSEDAAEFSDVGTLLAAHKRECQDRIRAGLRLRWDHLVKLDPYARQLSDAVGAFRDKTDEAMAKSGRISALLTELRACKFDSNEFDAALSAIQQVIDEMNLGNYSNLEKWVAALNTQVEAVLLERLGTALEAFSAGIVLGTQQMKTPVQSSLDESSSESSNIESIAVTRTAFSFGSPLVFELMIRNQQMQLQPPLEHGRVECIGRLHSWLGVVCDQKQLSASRYDDATTHDHDSENNTYLYLLNRVAGNGLQDAYFAIEKMLSSVEEYVQVWLQYESLWSMDQETIFDSVGDGLERWGRVIADMRGARATFDTSDTRKLFPGGTRGASLAIVDFAQVQTSVNNRYDFWQKSLVVAYGQRLAGAMRDWYSAVNNTRLDLEKLSVETASTQEAVSFVILIQEAKRKMQQWELSLTEFQAGTSLLHRQRGYVFPEDWIEQDMLEGEWDALREIVSRKTEALSSQIPLLQGKVVEEEKHVAERVRVCVAEWGDQKPVSGGSTHKDALDVLRVFVARVSTLKSDCDRVRLAQEALEIASDTASSLEAPLLPVEAEVNDLQEVWAALASSWAVVEDMRDTPWNAVAPRKIRSGLEDVLTEMKGLPNKVRQYDAFADLQNTLKDYLKHNGIIVDLKSEALRDRHWRELRTRLSHTAAKDWVLSDLTLGSVWDADLRRNHGVFAEVILQAQGELALEEFLKAVKEHWQTEQLDLVVYQGGKCQLIRGWDDIFTKLGEHLNSLTAMKMSPFFKVFEDEAATWEDRLQRLHEALDVWIDVQRQWVYLEGIFSGSSDIAALLPQESQRFRGINTEFVALMRRVAKSALILDVMGIDGLQKTLERLAENLNKVKKALGEYLERQRASFPRFYFIGDEDLLEIIGNSKDVSRTQKHLSKFFAGLSQLGLSDDGTNVTSMMSREGEVVTFKQPVDLSKGSKVYEWLSQVEQEMKDTLAENLGAILGQLRALPPPSAGDSVEPFLAWVSAENHPTQLVILAVQILWCESVEAAFSAGSRPVEALDMIERRLAQISENIMRDLIPIARKKFEFLVAELVHSRDVTRRLVEKNVSSQDDFVWLREMRFYWEPTRTGPTKGRANLGIARVSLANASFDYGFEYLGVSERIVQTPLTDDCYLTLTQALHLRLGGNPFGPAGTGKTETVKALGQQLGRYVLVFNCDESFDFQAMGRIFVGLCHVGAWGCFDEFNRLEERMLSAVSQQIQTILEAQKALQPAVELLGRNVPLHQDAGIFVTMNPGYAGRSNLPDNLKQLFRSIALIAPDRELIAEVMLFSQGFSSAERLAKKVVPLFQLCAEQLSQQPHYDFGLRALKSVLVSAGNIKRIEQAESAKEGKAQLTGDALADTEQAVCIRSVCETFVPKLVAEDGPLLNSLLIDVFPTAEIQPLAAPELRAHIESVCAEQHLEVDDGWYEKVVQLYAIQKISHGVMMVGPSGSGKTKAWTVLLEAMERADGIEGVSYVLDPKAVSKEDLFGVLDSTTREWTDGLLTHIIRKIIDNLRGEANQRHWIVLDGDVDPEWVENLNSTLDDNKLLTLPNGERLALPPNVRLMFEVQDLKYATLATVSRCGMVWFSDNVVSTEMAAKHYLAELRDCPLDDQERERVVAVTGTTNFAKAPRESSGGVASGGTSALQIAAFPGLIVQREVEAVIRTLLVADSSGQSFLEEVLEFAASKVHIMDFTKERVLTSFFALLSKGVLDIIGYNNTHQDFPLPSDTVAKYMLHRLLFAMTWGFAGCSTLRVRNEVAAFVSARVQTLASVSGVDIPSDCSTDPASAGASAEAVTLVDYFVELETGAWQPWQARVPTIEVESHKVASPDVVVPTVDTARHEEVVQSWLAEHRPLVLCGPPGSGKSMTLTAVLQSLPDLELATLNFSSASTPQLILNTFEQYCEYARTPIPGGGTKVVLRPTQPGKWLVVFCDEINLPAEDNYGTQRVISFIRQLTEQGGFWRVDDHTWVSLERIQFVGACNPPTDAGRVPLSNRFLRHAPILLVDFPSPTSLRQIYGTFCRALLKLVPHLAAFGDNLSEAMIQVYLKSQHKFTPDQHAHYIYSPRELSRWVRAIHEAIRSGSSSVNNSGSGSIQHAAEIVASLSVDSWQPEDLVRLWAHEGLRLFSDRLVEAHERKWTDEAIDEAARANFASIDHSRTLARPILYSNWLSREYQSVNRPELREFVKARLKVFYEEELDVPLVLFDEVLDHILRIDRVLRQSQGHALLIGVSGGGKTILSHFVAWMNGLSTFTIKVNNRYTAADFDEDLRGVMLRAGARGERICFIFDESNVLDSSFLERMNTLLAAGEVPGLFEGDDHIALMHACKDEITRGENTATDSFPVGTRPDTEDEINRWFTERVRRNLHVVFTMNPASPDFHNRSATSPALFNRCVLDWFGEWSDTALLQVGSDFTKHVDLDSTDGEGNVWNVPLEFPNMSKRLIDALHASDGTDVGEIDHRQAIECALVFVHKTIARGNDRLVKTHGLTNYLTPRHYLDFIKHFTGLLNEKREQLEEQQLHLNVGLQKMEDTQQQVSEMQAVLADKRVSLEAKNAAANEKLKQMVADQQIAEQKKHDSEQLGIELTKQNAALQTRQEEAAAELAGVEPAVEAAKQAVTGISKKNLQEIKALGRPPPMVQKTMEATCFVLSGKKLDWAAIRRKIMEDNFIPSIIAFDSRNIPPNVRVVAEKEYLADETFTFENVNRASKACGPLVSWLRAQMIYSSMLDKIKPLRDEMAKLESDSVALTEQQAELAKTIEELEVTIAKYTEEYAALIAEAQTIKLEMEAVQSKVERSVKLLERLGGESSRWLEQREGFSAQVRTLVGDALLSSAFLAYAGYYDQHYRASLRSTWADYLRASGVVFSEKGGENGPSLVDYLSTPAQQLQWQAHALPSDELCQENAVMLERFNRYPLVVDPSGQAATFLANKFAEKKILQTSFLDGGFMKHLESALRFGNPLLVHDVESIDPLLNPVLNREVYKKGGRILIKLGDQEVDFSPSFCIFLSTRDPTARFTPDLCSRVTLVNFTVTPSSLHEQCVHAVLQQERPEVSRKQTVLLKQQGEFKARLRKLEDDMLSAISAGGASSLLEDDTLVAHLEKLKNEVAEVQAASAEADVVMREVQETIQSFSSVGTQSSQLYFSLVQLEHLHFIYRFNLTFFLQVFHETLRSKQTSGSAEPSPAELASRVEDLIASTYANMYRLVARGLLDDDALVFALRLAQCRLEGTRRELPSAEFEYFMKGDDEGGSESSWPEILRSRKELVANPRAVNAILALDTVGSVLSQSLGAHGAEWSSFFSAPDCEKNVPISALSGLEGSQAAWRSLLICKALRPDRTVHAAQLFAAAALGDQFANLIVEGSSGGDAADIADVAAQNQTQQPMLLASAAGYDVSHRVEATASGSGKRLHAVAVGSEEASTLAEQIVARSARDGSWVLLKNIHLAPAWLVSLEKKLHALLGGDGRAKLHKDFRIFLTSEIHPSLPANLLRASQVLVFGAPPGVTANLSHTLAHTIPPARMDAAPAERGRLYLLVSWLHACLQERLRYHPLGWTKRFEFNGADLRVAFDSVDYWLESVARKKGGDGATQPAHVGPEDIPWSAIRTILSETVYGGKVDNDFDQRVLRSFVDALFSAKSFDADFELTLAAAGAGGDYSKVVLPDGAISHATAKHWAATVVSSATESPAWVGLPMNAEVRVLQERSKLVGSRFNQLQSIEIEVAADSSFAESGDFDDIPQAETADAGERPAWQLALGAQAREWLSDVLPTKVTVLERSSDSVKQPMWRYFDRELRSVRAVLHLVRADLEEIVAVCSGETKPQARTRALMEGIVRGSTPPSWHSSFSALKDIAVSDWLGDLSKRCKQLAGVAANPGCLAATNTLPPVWLGGLLTPEAFFTATRQAAAHSLQWSVELLRLQVATAAAAVPAGLEGSSFIVSGLSLEGADMKDNASVTASSALRVKLPDLRFSWVTVKEEEKGRLPAVANATQLPLYLNEERLQLLFSLDMATDGATISPGECLQRGVALLAWLGSA